MNAPRHPTPPRSRHARAFSLAETVVAAALLSIAATAAINLASSAAATRRITADRARALELARALLAEITSQAYLDPSASIASPPAFGPDAAEAAPSNRSLYDDVDDYNGWTESPPQAKDGTALAGFTGWARSVAVVWVDPANLTSSINSEKRTKRITVAVTRGGATLCTLSAIRTYAHDCAESVPLGTAAVTASSITGP